MKFPEHMKAAILVEQRKPLIIDQVDLPQVLEVGQVLIKVHYSGICGSQLGEIDGAKGEDKYLPHLLGHEASGTVIAVGPGVKNVKPDDNVVMHWRKGSGIEAVTPNYSWNGKKLNAGPIATFNEFAIVSENRVTTIDKDCDLQVAALFGCAVTTGFGVVENNAKVKIGESVLVYGAGGVGLNIIQASKIVGAYPIVAIDLYENRLKLAKDIGASHTINANGVNVEDEINRIFQNSKFDHFIDNTGNPKIIEMGMSLTHDQGKITLVGVPKAGNNINIFSLPLHFGKTISGSQGGESIPNKDIPRYYNYLMNSHMGSDKLITDICSLDLINEYINGMRNGNVCGRVLIKM